MCGSYDNLTGIRLCDASSEAPTELQSTTSDLPVINSLLTEDVFALVLEHCSVSQRARLASVCKLWNIQVRRGWKSITLQEPHLAKQLTWLKKIDRDTVQNLAIYGSSPILRASLNLRLVLTDLLTCTRQFAKLRCIVLEPNGQFLVSPSLLAQLSIFKMLETLRAGCTLPNIDEATNLSELAVLTSLKHLDLSFYQQTHLNLSGDLTALGNLTCLRLKGARSLQQQGGFNAGALSSILNHLLHLDLEVQGHVNVDMVAPMLTTATFSCQKLHSSVPALCPRLLTLELVTLALHAQHAAGMTALKSLTIAPIYGNRISPSAIEALQSCHFLAELEINDYRLGNEDLEDFSLLTSLVCLDLTFFNEGRRFSISPKLSSLRLLKNLHLLPRPEQQFSGGLHHLQSLSYATISGSFQGPPLHSKSLGTLAISGYEGFGFKPEEVLPLGSFPNLTSLILTDAVEAHMSRFVCLESLSSLKVLVMKLEYTAAAQPITTYQPADGDDVTQLLASLHALPVLQSIEIQAMRRHVLLEHVGRAHYKHLMLACATLIIPPSEAAALAELKSLRVVFETGHPETLDMLARLGASQKQFSAGDLYLCKELQEFRLGSTRASSTMDIAHHSLKTVYDDGYFL